MKKNILIKTMGLLAFVFLSCQKDDPGAISTNIQAEIQQVSNLLTTGAWHITSFIESGNDHTSNFNGYGFFFNTNGTLIADNGSTTVNGTWSATDSGKSGDDDSSDDIDFNVFFAEPASFNELNEDWNIVSRSDAKISLIHVSGGNGGTDTLTFEKN
ncbi:MAG: hypothetical protein MUO53_02415 [Maribacter sp.]|nr:hypothetical protein [Maribacter sp.]